MEQTDQTLIWVSKYHRGANMSFKGVARGTRVITPSLIEVYILHFVQVHSSCTSPVRRCNEHTEKRAASNTAAANRGNIAAIYFYYTRVRV